MQWVHYRANLTAALLLVIVSGNPSSLDRTLTAGQISVPPTCSLSGTPTTPRPQLWNNPPPFPVLLTPPDGAVVDTALPTFTWSEVGDSEGDTVIFHIQIDDSPDFGSPEVSERGQRKTSFVPARPLQPGTYCWRVRAIDDIEAASDYSAAFAVTIPANAGAATLR